MDNHDKMGTIERAMERLRNMPREEFLLKLATYGIGVTSGNQSEEEDYYSSMTDNDKIYEFELKLEADLASHELRKMADARTQYTDGRFVVLSNLIREMTYREVESAKWDMHCLTSVSIEKIDDNLYDVMRVADRVMYPN